MNAFDVLDPSQAIFGTAMLEASAGTGKTFAIEHLVVRMLLEAPAGEKPLSIERILAITFTKAAARDMRSRIRAAIEKAVMDLDHQTASGYLTRYADDPDAKIRLKDTLVGFEKAQIFTIHGFCHRVLAEFSLESRMMAPAAEDAPFRKTALPKLLDWMEQQSILCPEQIDILMKGRRADMDALCKKLLKSSLGAQSGSFAEDFQALCNAVDASPYAKIAPEKLREDCERQKGNYKKTKHDFVEEQIDALVRLAGKDEAGARYLIWKCGALFKFFDASNFQKKAKPIEGLHAPEFLDWARSALLPILRKASSKRQLIARLAYGWQKRFEELLDDEGTTTPDFLLRKMACALESPLFLECVQKKYGAAIIDEFQDTDGLQWGIFKKLFLDGPIYPRLFYMVGDPKQSIYRFRNADLYTYFEARRAIGSERARSLDTNYRSTPGLISALNALFSEEHSHPWLLLPKENSSHPYRPVKAGTKTPELSDGKCPLQFFETPDEEQEMFSYVAREIRALRPSVGGFGSFAILVKSHDQAMAIHRFLREARIPSRLKRPKPLGESEAAEALGALFDAIEDPRDEKKLKLFLSGPFAALPLFELESHRFLAELPEWGCLLQKKGLGAFFHAFFNTAIGSGSLSIYERTREKGDGFFRDVFDLVEQLLELPCFSFEAVRRFFCELSSADPEDDKDVKTRVDYDGQSVEILTMHGSKGLEFDIVFALGVSCATVKDEETGEESNAEKLRQMYVALTRAKLRLYIPIEASRKKEVEETRKSPLALFWGRSKLGENPEEIIAQLSEKNPAIGFSRLGEEQRIPADEAEEKIDLPEPPRFEADIPSRFIYSYSALARPKESKPLPPLAEGIKNLHTLPRGADTGAALHRIFERWFLEGDALDRIVREETDHSVLKEWGDVLLQACRRALQLPLPGGCVLEALPVSCRRPELEFLCAKPPHYLKGFADLVFIWQEKLYLLDWKTNWLGPSSEAYGRDALEKAMEESDYWLQASIYADAVQKAWPDLSFGGAIYWFLRGIDSPGKGLLFFQPEPLNLEGKR